MNESAAKLEFVEARLTLLERKVALLQTALSSASNIPESDPCANLHFDCNAPGLLVSNMYPHEWDAKRSMEFCWVGGKGPLQFVIPVRPVRPLICRLLLAPHPAVDMREMKVMVNDGTAVPETVRKDGMFEVSVKVPASAAGAVNVLLTGITSIRPSDKGENTDNRLLAARFFGADIIYPVNADPA